MPQFPGSPPAPVRVAVNGYDLVTVTRFSYAQFTGYTHTLPVAGCVTPRARWFPVAFILPQHHFPNATFCVCALRGFHTRLPAGCHAFSVGSFSWITFTGCALVLRCNVCTTQPAVPGRTHATRVTVTWFAVLYRLRSVVCFVSDAYVYILTYRTTRFYRVVRIRFLGSLRTRLLHLSFFWIHYVCGCSHAFDFAFTTFCRLLRLTLPTTVWLFGCLRWLRLRIAHTTAFA